MKLLFFGNIEQFYRIDDNTDSTNLPSKVNILIIWYDKTFNNFFNKTFLYTNLHIYLYTYIIIFFSGDSTIIVLTEDQTQLFKQVE